MTLWIAILFVLFILLFVYSLMDMAKTSDEIMFGLWNDYMKDKEKQEGNKDE